MQIDGNTQLVGIIADPIGQVRTPQLFNASVSRQGLNAVCVPFHVAPQQLRALLDSLPAMMNLAGMVVTVPHKEAVVAACAELTETARMVGSVNALRYDRDRRIWVGGNFDGDGFVAGLRERGHALADKCVLQVGAGGAGKAMAFAIARERPAELVIHNRSAEKAAQLVERLRAALPDMAIRAGGDDPAGFDVVVNATSLGLRDDDALPLPAERLAPGTLVCEAVVRDPETALLAAARARGCSIHHGQWMLYGQIVEIARFLGVPLEATFVERTLGPW
ncbi:MULTISPECIES: shikimate dehydrogenase family protein [Cupriavidus]|uniref:shikimate dehydrogenase family protein n=1 Tax=Cupriavidus sp. DF5525 TaxID=3160989 RepID=UPI0032DF484D